MAQLRGKERKGRGGTSLAPRERRRLAQLGTCLVLFLAVFLGKGIFPGQGEALRELLAQEADLGAFFTQVGQAVAGEEGALEALAALWSGDAPEETGGTEEGTPLPAGAPGPGERFFLWAEGPDDPASQSFRAALRAAPPQGEERAAGEEDQTPAAEPERAQPQAYTQEGEALPASVSLLEYDLGLGETAAPAAGVLSSPYGYRDHPSSGDYAFHRGVDLAAAAGTPILAFAAGTVKFIGQSDQSGLYVQLTHDNGVETFYAHCDTLLVGTGDRVEAGEQIATVGETGNATGPHLHFALIKDDVYLDPGHYLDLG